MNMEQNTEADWIVNLRAELRAIRAELHALRGYQTTCSTCHGRKVVQLPGARRVVTDCQVCHGTGNMGLAWSRVPGGV